MRGLRCRDRKPVVCCLAMRSPARLSVQGSPRFGEGTRRGDLVTRHAVRHSIQGLVVMPEDLRQLLSEIRRAAATPGAQVLIAWLPRLRAMARQHLPSQSPLRAGLDSEDLLQEGLLQLVRNVDRFRGSTWAEFLAFVHAILAQ